MKKYITAIAALILFTFILGSCAKQENQTGSSSPSPSPASTLQAATKASGGSGTFPLTVKDFSGFQMTISKKPEKIVSLTLGSDEILIELVDKSRIASITNFADDPGVSNIASQAKSIPTRLSSAESEKIIALKPDLVIVDSWAKKEFVQQLRDSGIIVYAFKTPCTIDDVKAVIQDLAKITGEEAKGSEMIASMDKRLKAVEDKVKTLKPEEKLTVLDYSEMGSTSGKGTNFDDIVTRAGLINIAAKNGLEGWPQISKEKIVEFNPDIVILPSWFYDKKNDPVSYMEEFKKDKSLATIKAVKNNRVITVPYPHISSISQYMVLGVEDVAKAAYPQLFK